MGKALIQKVVAIVVLLALLTGVASFDVEAAVDNNLMTIYDVYSKKTILSKGVVYDEQMFFTPNGTVNAHVVEIALENKNLVFDVLYPDTIIGKKDTLSNIIKKDSNIVAAINGDYFGMSGSYGTALGAMINNSGVLSIRNAFNETANNNYSFGITEAGAMFVDCLKTNISLTKENGQAVIISGVNKITEFDYSIILTGDYLLDTKELDDRIGNLYKIVVNDGIVTDVTMNTVQIPKGENSYAIIINSKSAYIAESFTIGEKLDLKYETSMDINEIAALISGGGVILKNGIYQAQGGEIVQPTARRSRTAIGYNEDKSKAYMIVIDGDGKSIGATNKETAAILLYNGVYEAMHLDGGGSSTMIARPYQTSVSSLLNTPSNGSQRAIVNALAIINNSELGNGSNLQFNYPSAIFANIPVDVSVLLTDDNYKKVEIEELEITVLNNEGRYEDSKLYLYQEGMSYVKVVANGVTDFFLVECVGEPHRVDITDGFVTWIGNSKAITASAISKNGYIQDITNLLEVESISDDAVGYVKDNKFYATGDGECIITFKYNNIVKKVIVGVGYDIKTVQNFETQEANNSVNTEYDSLVKYEGTVSLGITQINKLYSATFADFIVLEKGDSLSSWIKAELCEGVTAKYVATDAASKVFELSLGSLSDTNFKQYKVDLPNNIQYPLKINAIIFTDDQNVLVDESRIWLDNITTISDRKPKSLYTYGLITDYKNTAEFEEEDVKEISFYGNLMEDGDLNQQLISNAMKKSFISFFGNKTAYSQNINGFAYSYDNKAKLWQVDYAYIVSLSLKAGSLTKSDSSQIALLKELNSLKRKNIVIYCSKNPLQTTDKLELSMLDDILKEAAVNNNVIIIYQGNDTVLTRISQAGIRYFEVDSIKAGENPLKTKILKMTFSKRDFAYQIIDVRNGD